MQHTDFKGSRPLNPPRDWEQSKLRCDVLMVRDVKVAGIPSMESFWKPSEHDLIMLNNGACVKLTVLGGHPPVMLEVEKAPE